MGNLIDLTQTTEQAARYATWETTVSDPEQHQKIDRDVSDRFFRSTSAPIYTNTSNVSPESDTENSASVAANRLWGASQSVGEHASATNFHVDSEGVGTIFSKTDNTESLALSVGNMAARSGNLLENLSGNEWGLSGSGLFSALIKVPVDSAELREFGLACSEQGDDICLLGKGAILNDVWSAASDEQMVRRVRSLVPASALEPVGNAVSQVGNIPLFGELKDLQGAFGYVNKGELQEYRGE